MAHWEHQIKKQLGSFITGNLILVIQDHHLPQRFFNFICVQIKKCIEKCKNECAAAQKLQLYENKKLQLCQGAELQSGLLRTPSRQPKFKKFCGGGKYEKKAQNV